MKSKTLYEFNKSSAIKSGILLSVIIGLLITSFIYRLSVPGFSNYVNGIVLGATLFPILGITEYTWPPILKRIEK